MKPLRLWCSIGGWILIMPKARLLKYEEFLQTNINEHIKYFKGDDKYSNYGTLNNKIVKIDYGQLDS